MSEIFETLLWRGGPPPATWSLHLERLQRGAARAGLPLPSEDALRTELTRTVPAHLGLQRLRLAWHAGGPTVNFRTPSAAELAPPPAHLRLGPSVRDPAHPWAGCKHSAWQNELTPDQLVRSVDGAWSETCVANLLVGLDDGTIATPAEQAAPLPGTTLAALRLAGVTISPRHWATTEGVRWLLLLNAVRGASAVASVDGAPLCPPPADLTALAVQLVQPPP